MIPATQSQPYLLFPPRQIPQHEYPTQSLKYAARSLELKKIMISRDQNQQFNIASSIKLTEQQRKAVRKDQKDYIKLFTNILYRKFPSQLFLSQKELKNRIQENKKNIFEQKLNSLKPPKKQKVIGDKKSKDQKEQERKNIAKQLNKEESDRSEQISNDLGEMSQLDDQEDNDYGQDEDGNYEDEI